MKCIRCSENFETLSKNHRTKFCSKFCSQKHWAETHRDRTRAALSRWRKNNPDEDKKQRILYRSKAKLHRKEYARQYYLKHKHDFYLYTKGWRERNRGKSVQQVLKRRKRVRGLEGTYTYEEWEELKKKHNNCCVDCGRHESERKLTRDHVIPVTKPGATNYISNILPRCGPCNSRKSNHL